MSNKAPAATILLDSISPDGVRLTTMEVVMHRFVLAEFNTHRVFSRNSASSRAIPYKKMRERVSNNLAYPVYWGEEIKGMQSGDSLSDREIDFCKIVWESARVSATKHADKLVDHHLHKSLANRLLEPFMWHTVIVTSTYWDNFFAQRYHKDAQPEIRAAATAMLEAYNKSEPNYVPLGKWHLPLMKADDLADLDRHAEQLVGNSDTTASVNETIVELSKQVSTARCARSSYMNHHGVRDIADDLDLYRRLVGGMHPSPFEHVATPCTHMAHIFRYESKGDTQFDLLCKEWGNFYGWHQHRKEIVGENRTFDYGRDSGTA